MPPLPRPDIERERRVAEIRRRCEASGLPLTEARITILETMVDLDTHPSADEVHAEAARRQPGLGRATVYRTLESLVQIGAFTKVAHPGAAVRYDAVVAPHHHLVCLRCNAMFDLYDEALDAIHVPDTGRFGFDVVDLQVQLRGICQDCRDKEERS